MLAESINKLRSRLNATRFEFSLHIHSLQPWPASNKAIAIGWQRGKKRRGVTASILPLPLPLDNGAGSDGGGPRATVVRFNERCTFTATLYRVRAGTPAVRATCGASSCGACRV
jgi:hypothetical protein